MSESTIDYELQSSRDDRENDMRIRLKQLLSQYSIGEVSRATGYNNETVRRYLQGGSRMTADFVAQAIREYRIDANFVLIGELDWHSTDSLRLVPTELLINEFTKRYKLIEDYAVGHSVSSVSIKT